MAPRRALLLGATGAGVVALTGCGLRLERDAPHLPGLQTVGPPADQAALEGVLQRVRLAAAAAPDTHPWGPRLAAIHRQQAARLTQVMATQGMTVSSPTPATSTTAAGPSSLLAAERAGALALPSIARLSDENLPMAAAIVASQAAACRVLGTPIWLPAQVMPHPRVVLSLLPALRATTYGFEVIAARTPLANRRNLSAALQVLTAARADWEAAAGKAAPVEPQGYTLPLQPTSPGNRRLLGDRLLTDLTATVAGQLDALRGKTPQLAALIQLWADAAALGWQWSAAPAAFPGLR